MIFEILDSDARLWNHGPFTEATPETQILKLQAEVAEFLENPSIEEAGDILVCLSGWAWRSGYDFQNVLEYFHTKNLINLDRTWTRQGDGTWQHD